MKKFTTLLSHGASMLLAVTLGAAPLADDDFESYANGPLAGQNGGSGWGAAWSAGVATFSVNIVSASLTYSSGAVGPIGGGKALELQWNGAAKEGITAPLLRRALALPQTGTVYMSLLFRDIVDDLSAGNDNFVQFGFDPASETNGNPNASILRENGSFRARFAIGTSVASTVASGVGVTRLLVFKAERSGGNYNIVSLFVDPDSLIEPAVASARAAGDSGIASLDTFLSRSARQNPGDTFQIDNLLIGTAWEDVVRTADRAPFRIIGVIQAPGGEIDLTWNAVPGRGYAVWRSDNLVDWVEIVDSLVATGMTGSYQVSSGEAQSPFGIRHFRIEDRGPTPSPP